MYSHYFLCVFSLAYSLELHSKTIHRSEEFIKLVEKQFVTKLLIDHYFYRVSAGWRECLVIIAISSGKIIPEEIQSYIPQNFMVMNIPHPIIYYNTDFHWSLFMDIIIFTSLKTDS